MKNSSEAASIILKREDQELAKLGALKEAIDEGDASGVAQGDPFGHVLERLKRQEQTPLK